ncbi:hypothetical protein [Pseudomonas vancouverensis]|uniref:Uncharacterized protein n=1 Tax=Pseudomonas vancouverensis TaxID=95300 RepID=A0A1H2P088_PSEVA|nr:hypothetical protein [Pseudomonas vancouverensis]KAB0496669.1 hypothetical protein F7R09_13090 [Pseudomonas vancouverensis]TDB56471.1 hypothetical protein EIY72_29265 [Pseudomonas vancouverensis]SDV11068.1 hypothetical protein SAMN05216558_3355 [Pseudomonas vancouverensis]
MTATAVSSLAQLEYDTTSVECRVSLEQVEHDPFCFAIRVLAPLPEDLEQATALVLRVEGRRLQGTVRHSERLEDGSFRLEVEPD